MDAEHVEQPVEIKSPEAEFQTLVDRFSKVFTEKKPESWWWGTARIIVGLRKDREKLSPPMARFVDEHLDPMYDVLREQTKVEKGTDPIFQGINTLREAASYFQEIEVPDFPLKTVTLGELIKSGEILLKEDEKGRYLVLPDGSKVIIPEDERVLYKGGIARTILKLYLGASLKGELPLHDVDIVVDKKTVSSLPELKSKYHIDATGAEVVDNIDLKKLVATRDIDFNMVFFGKRGLVFTKEAERACMTRTIRAVGGETPLFGPYCFHVEGNELLKSGTTARLIKFVTEDKADRFAIKALDRQVPLGLYWLALIRPHLNSPRLGEYLNRIFHMANQMGQAKEETISEWLQNLHENYPEFDFGKRITTGEEAFRWLFGKVVKLAKRKFKMLAGIENAYPWFRRFPGDEREITIGMKGYESDEKNNQAAATAFKNIFLFSKEKEKTSEEWLAPLYGKIQHLENLAYLRVALEEVITQNPDVSENELLTMVRAGEVFVQGERVKVSLDEVEEDLFKSAIQTYIRRHREINTIRSLYLEGMSLDEAEAKELTGSKLDSLLREIGESMYLDVFEFQPEGKVVAFFLPNNIHLLCFGDSYNKAVKPLGLNPEAKSYFLPAEKPWHSEEEGLFVIERAAEGQKYPTSSSAFHEEQHSINFIMRELLKIDLKDETRISRRKRSAEELRWEREVKDETFAFFAGAERTREVDVKTISTEDCVDYLRGIGLLKDAGEDQLEIVRREVKSFVELKDLYDTSLMAVALLDPFNIETWSAINRLIKRVHLDKAEGRG